MLSFALALMDAMPLAGPSLAPSLQFDCLTESLPKASALEQAVCDLSAAGDNVMSDYDYLSLIKRHAKKRSKIHAIKLKAAQEAIALEGGFQHFYELRKVAVNHPNDTRLMRVAFQTDDITQVVYADEVYDRLNTWLDDELSSYMAETNAYGFSIDELDVSSVDYDESTGVLSVDANISYVGDQDPDRPYSGNTFYVNAIIHLFQRSLHWELLDTDDCLQIVKVESDQDRDWEKQQLNADIFKNPALAVSESSENSSKRALEKAVKATGVLDLENVVKATGALDLERAVKATGALDLEKAVKATGALDLERAVEATGVLDLENAVKATGILDLERAVEATGALDLEKAVKATGVLDLENAVKATGILDLESVVAKASGIFK